MNLPEVKFILKDPGSPDPTPIFMVARYNNRRLVYSIGMKILPDYWDPKARGPIKDKAVLKNITREVRDELVDLQTVIDQHRSELQEILRGYKVKREFPPPVEIKLELDKKFNKASQASSRMTLFSWIEQLIRNANKRPVTIKGYLTTLNHLKVFQSQYRRRIDFYTVDLDFYDDFVKYFQERGYAMNSIGKNIKNLKVFMGEATERGFNTNMDFRNKRFRVTEENTDQVYLTEQEILKIYRHHLVNKKSLEKVRDIFVAACYTGLRFSDLSQICDDNITGNKDGKLLKVKTQKTGEVVVIPLHPVVLDIMKKYDGRLPRIPSNQKLNSFLKEIGDLAGMSEKVPITKTRGGFRTSTSVPKFKLITMHTARRSFATNAYLAGVPVISIMKITGHRTERSFMKYIRITKEDNARKLLDHPFFNSANLKLIEGGKK
jgi:integrase